MSESPVFAEIQSESDDRIAVLIEAIQNYTCLYNLSSKDYKNRIKKDAAWKQVAEIAGLTVDECIKKWKMLRDRFTREKRSFPTGSQAPESSWQYFEIMQFYSKYSRPRKTHTATPSCIYKASCSSAGSAVEIDMVRESSEKEQPYESEEMVLMDLLPEDEDTLLETPKTSRQSKRALIQSSVKDVHARKKRKTVDHELLDVINTAKKIATTLEVTDRNEGTNRTFVEYVHSILSEMPENEAKLKRREILLILDN